METLAIEIVNILKANGLQVYMRNLTSTYCYCTDGTHIAYVEWGNRDAVSTVHKPNKQIGTGFHMFDEITPASVRSAMQTVAPGWAKDSDRKSVIKYKSWDDFHKSSKWNAELFQV
jgi:hypothetical protein